MKRSTAAAIAIFSVALPLSAHCAVAHRHVARHHATASHSRSIPAAHRALVSADISGHAFHMPRRIRRAHLRAVKLHTLHHPSIRFRALYEPATSTEAPFTIDNWSAPYYVAYPAPIAGSRPSTSRQVFATPRPTTQSASTSPVDSSSRTAPAFEAAPAPDPTNPPADSPGIAAVTIVFKDGRPSQQVRNYILTRKALFIGVDNQPAIPVEQLDLIATVKANEEAGVTFQLPPTIQ